MAKKEEKPKIVTEREYVIPLRKEFQKTPKYKRAKKTITAVKEFLIKHMKSDNVKLGKYLNLKVWENGIKNPPNKIKVKVEKYDDGLVKAELVGAPVEKPKEEKKKPVKKTEKAEEKKLPDKKEQKKETKQETVKEENKENLEKKQQKKEIVKKEPEEDKVKEKEKKKEDNKPKETEKQEEKKEIKEKTENLNSGSK